MSPAAHTDRIYDSCWPSGSEGENTEHRCPSNLTRPPSVANHMNPRES